MYIYIYIYLAVHKKYMCLHRQVINGRCEENHGVLPLGDVGPELSGTSKLYESLLG